MKKCRENRFRKGMAVLLSAVLVIGMASGVLPAEVCASEGEHTHDGYTEWTKTDSLPTVAGNYYLTRDVTIKTFWNVPTGTTNLCLNGKTIKRTETTSESVRSGEVIYIPTQGALNLYDCPGGGTITGATSLSVENRGKFYMYGGEISGNAGHILNKDVFYMYGGKISDNIGGIGGVENHESTFYMYGGEISGNSSSGMVSGVLNTSGVFYMYGGKISENSADDYGTGGVRNTGTFYMYGGEISENIDKKDGGAGGVVNLDTFYMYGGKITNNIGSLGGVHSSYPAKMVVGGTAVINGNKNNKGKEINLCFADDLLIEYGGEILFDSDNPLSEGARIGITSFEYMMEKQPIPFTGKADQDYSSYFYSDDANYSISDSVDHAVWLVPNGEHKHVTESWSHDDVNHWKQCPCGQRLEEAAHAFDDWVTDQEATDTEDGEKHRECSVCGFQETEVIPATRPTAPPTPSPTPVPTATPTPVPTPTATPPVTEKPTPTPLATAKPTTTPKPIVTAKPTEVPKPEATEKPSAPPTPPATKKPGATSKPAATEQPPATKEPSATPKPTATKQPPATAKPEATKQPAATSKPMETVRPGAIRLEVEVKGNAPDTMVSTSAEEMADRILTEKDRKELENGQDIGMYVVVTDISGSVSEADRALAEVASAGYTTGQYLDISLYKEVGGERTRVRGPLAGNISLTLSVPDGLKNTDRTKTREFAVVRVHNGAASMLSDGDSDADTITFDTDRFSTYEIVYKDTAAGSNTGNGNGSIGGNQNNAGSPSGVSPTGVPGSTGKTVNNSHNGGNTNVSSEKKSESGSSKETGDKSDSKDSRDKKSGGTVGHTRDREPKTGDVAPLELVATLAMISGLSYVLLYFLERRRGMTEETKKEITARIIAWAKKGGRLRKGMAIAAIFVFLVYYHSIGKEIGAEWREAYDE